MLSRYALKILSGRRYRAQKDCSPDQETARNGITAVLEKRPVWTLGPEVWGLDSSVAQATHGTFQRFYTSLYESGGGQWGADSRVLSGRGFDLGSWTRMESGIIVCGENRPPCLDQGMS